MEFKNYQEALAYVNGQVPGATPEQIEAAKAYLSSAEGQASAQQANTPIDKSKGEVVKTLGGNNAWWDEAHDQKEAEKKLEETQKYTDTHLEGQDGLTSRGNQGDNAIKNPDAPDTAEVTKRHLEEKAAAQTPDNMEPATFSSDPVDFENKGKGVGSFNYQKGTDGESAVEKAKANRYQKQARSIWDAYYNGDFGEVGSEEAKKTRNYFIIDAVANFSKNLGRNVGNIGAQYSGGTIDNAEDKSKWSDIQNTLGQEELNIEKESDLNGAASRRKASEVLDNELKRLSKNRSATINDLMNSINEMANDSSLSNTERQFYLTLAAQLAGAGLDGSTQLATIGSGAWNDIKEGISNFFGGNNK